MAVDLKNVDMEWFKDEEDAGDDFENISAIYPTPERARDRERVRRGIELGRVTAKRLVKRTSAAHKGPIYVNVKEAERWLMSSYYAGDLVEEPIKSKVGRPQHTTDMVRAAEKACTSGTDYALRQLAAAMDRIADAIELWATQPGNPHHTPFVTHLHASTNGEA